MDESEEKRIFRDLRLSLHDINQIVGALRDLKSFWFKKGNKEKVDYLNDLESRLVSFYTKGKLK